jgi:hypothetical protein
MTKKTVIDLIGICKTNKEIPKQTVPIPRMKTHRVVISIIYYFALKAGITSAYLITCAKLTQLSAEGLDTNNYAEYQKFYTITAYV